MISALRVSVLLILAALLQLSSFQQGSALARAGRQSDKRHVWCWSASLKNNKIFYAGVFAASANRKQAAEQAYTKYMVDHYFDDNPGPGVCNFYNTEDQARSALRTDKANSKFNDRQIVDTGWSYSE